MISTTGFIFFMFLCLRSFHFHHSFGVFLWIYALKWRIFLICKDLWNAFNMFSKLVPIKRFHHSDFGEMFGEFCSKSIWIIEFETYKKEEIKVLVMILSGCSIFVTLACLCKLSTVLLLAQEQYPDPFTYPGESTQREYRFCSSASGFWCEPPQGSLLLPLTAIWGFWNLLILNIFHVKSPETTLNVQNGFHLKWWRCWWNASRKKI